MPGTGSQTSKKRGPRHDWTKEEYTVLYLLHTQWQLSSKDVHDNDSKNQRKAIVEQLFCKLYPNFVGGLRKKKGSRSELLWVTYSNRFQQGKSKFWFEIDRPHPKNKNKTKYSEAELAEFARLKERIKDAAKELNITLVNADAATPLLYDKDAEDAAVDALLKLVEEASSGESDTEARAEVAEGVTEDEDEDERAEAVGK